MLLGGGVGVGDGVTGLVAFDPHATATAVQTPSAMGVVVRRSGVIDESRLHCQRASGQRPFALSEENGLTSDRERARRATRVLSLDVLRAVAILLVLGVHAPAVPGGDWGSVFCHAWQRCGWAGVDLFFALSGYLIVGLLLDERHCTGTIDVKAFACRRIFKIFPPYLLFLGAALVWFSRHGSTPGVGPTLAAFWPTAAHLQNYIPVPAVPHLWSLAMEEHAYALMLGLVVLAGWRADALRTRTIPIALLGIFLASWLGRWAYVVWGYSGNGPIGSTYTHNRIDAVLAGSFAAWLVHRTQTGIATAAWLQWRLVLLAVGGACFVPTLILDPYTHRPLVLLGVLPLQALGFGLLLLGLAARAGGSATDAAVERRPPWPLRALAFIGISSYSTYLWHWPFADVLTRVGLGSLDGHPAGALARVVTFVALALIVGALSFALVERPALAWRRRWLAAAKGRAEPSMQQPSAERASRASV
jgi:peptidoglycan/LPS O-acetylase OafA/YrhL